MKEADHPTGAAIRQAVAELRARLDEPTAPIAVLTPSTVNGALARQALGATAPFIRVSFLTPAQLHHALAAPALRRQGLRPTPPGWTRATLAHLLGELELGAYGEVMRQPGWLPALTAAVEALEAGGVSGAALRELDLSGDLGARATLLAALLEGLEAARTRDGIAGPAAEAKAARTAVAEGHAVPANAPRGAVILGDARSPRRVAETLAAWLAERAVVRVGLAPLEALPPARGGAREARPDAPVVPCEPPQPAVRMVRTPDPVREQAAIVRRVLDAVRDGVPFDRIAIVLPDPSEAVALREALDRANVPATWMTGPPLASTPAARLLLHALRIARGEDTVASFYELLSRPGLRLRRAVGAGATTGRGRWRRILASCGAYRGTSTIRRALEATLAELGDGAAGAGEDAAKGTDTPAPDAREAAREAERAATSALLRCVAHFADLFASWSEPRPVGAWARTWLAFVGQHWREGADTRALSRLLEGWSRADAGPAQPLDEAAVTLEDALGTTPVTRGSLRDPAVRVLSPMQCLGADFERVCVASMTQGRFPVDPSEDPILSDALLDAIEARVDAGLFRSGDRVALERRRFAAVRSAARGELWVSCPRVDMMKGRPLLPGSLLLDLAEEVHGRRLGFAALEAALEPAGRRSRPYPRDPARALDAAEHLLARLMEGDADTRAAALRALADHPTAARLLRAHRAADLVRAGARSSELRPHAGFVPVEVLPCRGLDGAPLTPSALEHLLQDPASFFLRRVLGAWPAKRLREDFDPARGWYVTRVLGDHARALLREPAAPLAEELLPRFEATVDGDLERAGLRDETTAARVRRLGRRLADRLLRAEPNAGPPLALEAAPVAADLPWRLESASARRVGASLEWLVERAPAPKAQREGYGHLAELAAARARGDAIDAIRWVGVDGSTRVPKEGPDGLLEGFHARLALVTEMVAAGAFPGEGPAKLRLDATPESAVDERWWETWRR